MPFRNLYYSMLGNILYFYCNHTKTTVAFILQMDNPEQEENPCCFFHSQYLVCRATLP